MDEEHNEILNKYEKIDLMFIIILVLMVWGMFGIVIFDNRGIYVTFERIVFLSLIIPSMFIWTYLGIVNVRKYRKKRNNIGGIDVKVNAMRVGDKTEDGFFIVLRLSREEVEKASKIPLTDAQIGNLCDKIGNGLWELTGQDAVDEIVRVYTEDL